jgi:hypothetical protein
MAWVRIDDGYAEHPKMLAAGAEGIALDIAAMCYCARQTTDGFVPAAVVDRLVSARKRSRIVQRLVDVGRWTRDEERDGYLIHDYLKFNPSASDLVTLRNQKSAAGKAGAHRRWHSDGHGTSQKDSMANGMADAMADQWQPHSPPLPTPTPVTTGGARNFAESSQPSAAPLVDTYVQHCEAAGWTPSSDLKKRLGREAKKLLADGVPESDVLRVLMVAARERKSPSSLPLLHADLQVGRNGTS